MKRASMRRKKTQHEVFQILDVQKLVKGMHVRQQYVDAVSLVVGDRPIPEGLFTLIDGRVHCAKRRGEKVFAHYTSSFYEEI